MSVPALLTAAIVALAPAAPRAHADAGPIVAIDSAGSELVGISDDGTRLLLKEASSQGRLFLAEAGRPTTLETSFRVETAALSGDGRVEVVRTVDDLEETLSLALPVVVGVAARSAEARAPGMKELLAARKRPVTRTSLAELGVEVPEPLVDRGTHLPATAPTRVFDGEPGEAARQLVAALRNEGVL